VCNMPCRSHPPWFYQRTKIWWIIQISGALHNAVFSGHFLLPLSFPDSFLNALFSRSFNPCSVVSTKDHVLEFSLWDVKQFFDRRMNDILLLSQYAMSYGHIRKSQPLCPVTAVVPWVQLHNVLLSGNRPNFLFLGYLTAYSRKNFP
jgi:hypothetical protein